MAEVTLRNVSKSYADTSVLEDFNLEVQDREFVVLVGPSGCGKSTALRLIAGLEALSGGDISIGGRVVNELPPKDRDIAMVFQNYALYPHMTVRENLEFGLNLRGTPRAEVESRVAEAAEILDIAPLLDRRPKQLSGGQRQRVAVGRAIVRKPAVFLFDEPLSNLDARLRVQMRAEIKTLQGRLQTTTVYVTHDQVEAMTMGSRIAVMRKGRIQQIGTPLEVYDRPRTVFVAGFLGSPPMNIFRTTVAGAGERLEASGFVLPVPPRWRLALSGREGKPVIVGLRPESLREREGPARKDLAPLDVEVQFVEPLGDEVIVHGRAGSESFLSKLGPHRVPEVGSRFALSVDSQALHLFDPETEQRLEPEGVPDPMTAGPRFPDGFLWGAATSAYQVEGSPLADGAGPSIWHRFSHTPGRVRGGDTGDVACDHYRRFQEDVGWMKVLGLSAYRFSISWSRVLPEGTGRVNPKGLDFYRGLVDALLEAGIEPWATLYHWDLPAALDDRGGWQNRDVADWFTDYARVMFAALDDRVAAWTTINEPWVVSDGGYLHGPLAPGHRSLFEAPIVSHNLLRAHGAAVGAYRADGRRRIGLVVNLEPKYPASPSSEDLAATSRSDAYMNRQFLDPVFFGRYPEEMPEIFGPAWPDFPASDLDAIRRPIDFLGVNYYTRGVVRNQRKAWPVGAARVRQPGLHTEMGWEVYPDGLFDTLRWVRERYGSLPLYVTENGAAFKDPKPSGGMVDDPLRVAYYRDHLLAARRAIAAGVDLRGYFAWSLLDNFEWSEGFSKRFGLLRVDPRSRKRSAKASARFYASVIASAGAILD